MTEAVWRKYPNGLGGWRQPRSAHKLIDRCCDQKVSVVAKPKESRPELREGSEAQIPQIQVSAGQAGRAAPEETPGQAESGPSWGGIPDARKGRGLVDAALGGLEPGLETGPGLGSRKGPGLPGGRALRGGAWRRGREGRGRAEEVSEAGSGLRDPL